MVKIILLFLEICHFLAGNWQFNMKICMYKQRIWQLKAYIWLFYLLIAIVIFPDLILMFEADFI